jgi:hypothetical protein
MFIGINNLIQSKNDLFSVPVHDGIAITNGPGLMLIVEASAESAFCLISQYVVDKNGQAGGKA